MIKADIPQDVTEYKEQFFFGLTIRQFVCGIAMVALAVITFLIGSKFVIYKPSTENPTIVLPK